MVSPVEYSAIAGGTGRRSRGRTPANARSLAPSVLPLDAAVSAFDSPRDTKIGTRDRHSAPPATTTWAWPVRTSAAPSAIAWLADAHARDTVTAGTEGGSVDSPTSRAMLGACGSWTTVPKIK